MNATREWLKELRDKRGLSQVDVAKKSNIERPYYTMIEQGKRNPSVKVAKDIANTLNFNWTIFLMINVTNRNIRNIRKVIKRR